MDKETARKIEVAAYCKAQEQKREASEEKYRQRPTVKDRQSESNQEYWAERKRKSIFHASRKNAPKINVLEEVREEEELEYQKREKLLRRNKLGSGGRRGIFSPEKVEFVGLPENENGAHFSFNTTFVETS